ncbi:MAG TPA: beta-L-arabinofuranosidase domain-containing protein [Actinopolymorphaceae bacterium]
MTHRIRRRDLLASTGLAGGVIAFGQMAAGSGTAHAERRHSTPPATRTGHYVPQMAPLQPVPFQKLPPGAVRPRGWLLQQLELQADGLCGRYDEVSDFLVYEDNGWVDPSKWAWEELPYWLRGLGDLGYVTGDDRILAKTQRWIEGILGTQSDDGWFGPEALRTSLEGGPDLWPGMPLLGALRSWQEYTGDERVVPFMTKYFAFQNSQPPEVFNRSWGAFRWGDNIDTAYWLYNRTGEEWLLDLVTKMHENSADYTNDIPTWHNVNLAQGFREPLQYGLLAGDPRFRKATYDLYDTVMKRFGQFPGGGFAGDENCRPGFGDPRQGFETCGIVEFMHSFEMLVRFTGDIVWADRCEELAFNSLPAALDPQQRSIHYITCANSIQLDDRVKHGQFDNGFAMQAYKPGVHQYRCCPHNYGIGWPYFTEELWLATTDYGLAASMYAPNEVRATVGEQGTVVTIVEDTDYPFDDRITLRVSTPHPVRFPLYLRIPLWAEGATVRTNGTVSARVSRPGTWVTIDRAWRAGDTVELHLPMRTSVRRWKANHNAVSVEHGPLTFSLEISERWERFAGSEAWPEYAVYPDSPWNYGLLLPDANPARTFELHKKPLGATNPFTPDGTPLRLRAKARRIAEWEADNEDVVGLLQPSPARTQAPVEDVTLIPMGAARLRITAFPTAVPGDGGRAWVLQPIATASHIFAWDSYEALYDGREPTSSADTSIPRFTWWDRRGTVEWVQLDLREPRTISQVSVYWFDDTGFGECRVPASWRLLWRDERGEWQPVSNPSEFGVELDRYNTVTFDPVRTQVIRIEAQLRETFSGGILELIV